MRSIASATCALVLLVLATAQPGFAASAGHRDVCRQIDPCNISFTINPREDVSKESPTFPASARVVIEVWIDGHWLYPTNSDRLGAWFSRSGVVVRVKVTRRASPVSIRAHSESEHSRRIRVRTYQLSDARSG